MTFVIKIIYERYYYCEFIIQFASGPILQSYVIGSAKGGKGKGKVKTPEPEPIPEPQEGPPPTPPPEPGSELWEYVDMPINYVSADSGFVGHKPNGIH